MIMKNIRQIGIIRSKFKESANPGEMKKHESIIKISEDMVDGLFKIEDSEYIDIIFSFHLSNDYKLKLPTFTGEVKGVFASRSPKRPNPIGITTVKLLERKGNLLRVTGLDALNGTPVLDIKPGDNSIFQGNNNQICEHILKANPRIEIMSNIWAGETDKLLLKAGQLHGHFCPGLAMGVMAATRAMKLIRGDSDGMEDLLVIVETNNCVSDGIQFVTGCSFGNNSLIFKDIGKIAFTLTKRSGNGIRIFTKANSKDYIRQANTYFSEKYNNVIKGKHHSDEEIAQYKKAGIKAAFSVLMLDFEKIFNIENVKVKPPEYAPSHESIICAECGEPVMSSRVVKKENQKFCIHCSKKNYFQLDGNGISKKNTKTDLF